MGSKADTKRDIKLGDIIRDTVSGMEGVYASYTIRISGNNRVDIQPVSKDKEKFADGGNVDMENCVYVKDGPGVVMPPHSYDIKMGEEVEDVTSGFKGTVVGITTFMNGCVYAEVQGKVDKDGKRPDAILLSTRILKSTGKQVVKAVQEVVKKVAAEGTNPGGPRSARLRPH